MSRQSTRRFRAPAGAALLLCLLVIGATALPGCGSDRSQDQAKTADQAALDTTSTAPPPSQSLAPPADSAGTGGGGPHISFPEPSHDFGKVIQGKKLQHVFAVQNTGTEPLKLIRAKGS